MFAIIANAQVTSVGLIGSATPGGWDNDTPMTQLTDSTWTLDVTLSSAEAKFRANGTWDVNWGAKDFPEGIGTQGGPNIPVFAGDYTVNFNSLSGLYSFNVKSDIGIIGDATQKGWGEDTNLYIADSVNYYTLLTLKQGEAKFRQNDAWDINWGDSAFPEGVGTQDGSNIKVSSAGKYRIDFNKATGAYKFSEVVEFSSIGVIGSATPGGWDNETALTKDGGNPDLWKGVVAIKEGELKFRANNAWTISWGGGTFPSDTSAGSDNIVVPAGSEGDYQVSFNTKSLIYNFLKIGNYQTVGIIGDATPLGWDNSTPMVQDATDRSLWTLRVKLKKGEAKFRANNAWDVNWGADSFPTGTGTQDGANIPIEEGDYKISFNSTTGDYNFVAVVEFSKISLVGNAGPFGDWPGADDSRDTYLNKDPNNANHWTLASVELKDTPKDGGIKFRAEAAWAVNWGSEAFPVGTGTQDGKNIVCTAGTYKIDFRSDTGDYAFAEPSSTYDLLSGDVISISPNPAKDVLNIGINTEVLKGSVNIAIFNVNGTLVKNQKADVNGSARINVSDIQSGNYVVRISNDKNIVAKSIIIIK
ncbi:MAG: SusF/SusE family outer membrane protein [Saprospiraceae bacterium]|nr:SusF/SusE family outer membrane protein [Saprospiraceae bacterium]